MTLELHGVDLGDSNGRFAFLGLDGAVQWRDRQPEAATRVRLEAARQVELCGDQGLLESQPFFALTILGAIN